MGRRIYDQNGDFVWKYVFAEQASEQSRVVTHLRIGKLTAMPDNDILRLTRKDVEKLDKALKPKRGLLARFYREERNIYTKKDGMPYKTAGFDDAKNFYAEMRKLDSDILFWLMCRHFVRHAKKFFKAHAKIRVLKLYGEY